MSAVRATGAEVTSVEAEGMTDIAAVTGMHAGAKGIQPIPRTPKTNIDSSGASRPIAAEVGWYEFRIKGKHMG